MAVSWLVSRNYTRLVGGQAGMQSGFTAETQRAQRKTQLFHRKGAKDAKKTILLKTHCHPREGGDP
jgi:hypothetical protein